MNQLSIINILKKRLQKQDFFGNDLTKFWNEINVTRDQKCKSFD